MVKSCLTLFMCHSAQDRVSFTTRSTRNNLANRNRVGEMNKAIVLARSTTHPRTIMKSNLGTRTQASIANAE
eukprot:1258921-Amphidinium_carterae.1